MYEAYYSLTARPFALNPDPRFLYQSTDHQHVMTLLRYALGYGHGFALVTGEIGCGKTTLIRHALATPTFPVSIALLANTHTRMGPLLPWVAQSFGVPQDGLGEAQLHARLVDRLAADAATGRRPVLIVDEAQNLGLAGLEELRVLSNVNYGPDQLLQTVLVGQPELRSLLRQPVLRQLAQRISVDHHLGPLGSDETRAYVAHRIAVAGRTTELFTPFAVELVHRFSGGVPRLVNVLCEMALLYGFAEFRPVIDKDTVAKVIRDRGRGGVLPLAVQRPPVPAAAPRLDPPPPHHPPPPPPPRQARRSPWRARIVAAALCGMAWLAALPAASALTPAQVGLVVNGADPYSRTVAEYYRQRRHIPAANVVTVDLPVAAEVTPLQFARAQREVQQRLPATVQVLALAWTLPYRVGCLSVTSAFAQGFDPARCATGCVATPFSPYYNSDSAAPYRDFGIRPAMLLAARDVAGARALVDRGLASDGSRPRGTAYLLDTSDADRNARQPSYASARGLAGDGLRISVVDGDFLLLRRDVLFFFTGTRHVWLLGTNRFLPGAIGDHLTSSGGVLDGRRQMNALAWIAAGATGSYGTVVEPCAITGKFPAVPIVMRRYLAGETLVEAYWKSVAMPSQGVFVGDPLAAPFRKGR